MKAANYLLLTEFRTDRDKLQQALSILKSKFGQADESLQYYYSDSLNSVLIMRAIKEPTLVFEEISKYNQAEFLKNIAPLMRSDWRRHVLEIVEPVKAQASLLPNTAYIQLRHIEVPLSVYQNYISWRKQTIFEHVRKQDLISSFMAYHSLLSTEPGVMFLAGFNCLEQDYVACFNNPHYQNIIKEAGQQYIAGGEKGLYTHIYQRAD